MQGGSEESTANVSGSELIVLHSHYFYPSVGGCETFADLLAAGLAARGRQVRLVTGAALDNAAELKRNYEIVRISCWEDDAALDGAAVIVSNGPSVRYLRLARRRRIPTVLVHAGPHGDCPAAIGWRDGQRCTIGLPRCLTCRVCDQRLGDNVRNLARHLLLRRAMRGAAANVFVSHYLQERIAAPRSRVIWNCYNDELFRPLPFSPQGQTQFVFAGRLVSIKGVDVALRGFALARQQGLDARLRIVGSGPLQADLQRLTADLAAQNAVAFQPFAPSKELAMIFQQSWAMLLPTQCEEAFGIVVAEAMGCGCPVIASAHGGPPEVVADTGLLVPAADPAAWARAMHALAVDPARRQSLAAAAAARAHREFTRTAMVDRYEALLDQVALNAQACR